MKKVISCAIVLTLCIALTGAALPKCFLPLSSAVVFGDVDGDGSVTSADARLILRASIGLEKLSGDALKAADTDGDGSITSADARLALRHSIELDKTFPVEKKADPTTASYSEISRNGGTKGTTAVTTGTTATVPVTQTTSVSGSAAGKDFLKVEKTSDTGMKIEPYGDLKIMLGMNGESRGTIYSVDSDGNMTSDPNEIEMSMANGKDDYISMSFLDTDFGIIHYDSDIYLISNANKLYCKPSEVELKTLGKYIGYDFYNTLPIMHGRGTEELIYEGTYTDKRVVGQPVLDVIRIVEDEGTESECFMSGDSIKYLVTVDETTGLRNVFEFESFTAQPSPYICDPSTLGYKRVLLLVNFVAKVFDLFSTDGIDTSFLPWNRTY